MGLELPPGALLILGGLAAPLLRGPLRGVYLLALGLASLWGVLHLPDGVHATYRLFGLDLVLVRADALARGFAVAFHGALLAGLIYALRLRDGVQQVAAPVYAGAAIGALYAGDFLSLFVYWELTAVASVLLVWAARSDRALRAGLRYLLWQVTSGVLLLAAAALLAQDGDLALREVAAATVAGQLLLLAFGIKAAFPLLHAWVPDAYARATPAGAVFLSAFSTKLALYALARVFPGAEILVPIGVAGAVLGTLYAAAQDDLRRMLAYALVAQLGVSTAGIGLGGAAFDGALRHALAGIAYFGLLFMATGAVLERTGQVRISALAGTGRAMPWTFGLLLAGAAAAAGLPLLAGYPGKALVLDEAALAGAWPWLGLNFAAAGMGCLAGLRLPWALTGAPRAPGITDAPWEQRLAMLAAAGACVVLGVVAGVPAAGVPAPDFRHAGAQLLLLAGVALVFGTAVSMGGERRGVHGRPADADWALRHALPQTFLAVRAVWGSGMQALAGVLGPGLWRGVTFGYEHYVSPRGLWGRAWPTGRILLYTATVLAAYLVLSFL